MDNLFETQYSGYDQPVLDIEAVRFNIYLISFKACEGIDRVIEKGWYGLKFSQFKDRKWYFRRVAAKMQMDNPFRVYCFLTQRTLNDQDATKAAIKRLADKQRSAKAKITEITNKIQVAKANWNRLFPIEDDEGYQKAMAKLFSKMQDLAEFQKEIDQLSDSIKSSQ